MWYFKCRECGSEFEENENLPMKPNPSGIMQEVCPKCGGAFNHEFRPTPRAADVCPDCGEWYHWHLPGCVGLASRAAKA